MDHSANTSTNNAQHLNGQSFGLLNGIEDYSNNEEFTVAENEDLSQYFDPELFDSTTFPNGLSQTLPAVQNITSSTARQSSTPEQHPYTSSQHDFQPQSQSQTQQYSQPYYDIRQISQQTYDPRFYARPTASPITFNQGFSYHSPLDFQSYNPQQLGLTQRHTPTPLQDLPQRQQQSSSPFVNIASRPGQPSHVQNPGTMRYANYQAQVQQQAGRFVDPSMLSGGQTMNGAQGTNPYMASGYLNQPSTADPRSMQAMQSLPTSALSKLSQPIISKSDQTTKAPAPKDPNAPIKRPRGRPRKDGTVRSIEKPAEFDSSEDELEIAEEEPEMTPAILTLTMPADERGRAIYQAVHAVWSPRNKPAQPEKVRNGIALFGDIIRGLRDAWKTKNESLRKAELPNSPTAGDTARLKEQVAHYRQIVENVMQRSMLYSHPAISKRLGENQFTMSALQAFMLDRFNASDFDSALVGAILKFVVRFETLDMEMLEQTKLSKILQRLTKKATTEIKSLAQNVLDNAAVALVKKASEKKNGNPPSPQTIGSPAEASRKDAVAGVKRSREGDVVPQPAAKKPLKTASEPLAVRLEKKRKAEEAAKRAKVGEKPAATTSSAAAGVTNGAAKTKVAITAPPKPSVFSALSSVSKKPGTSNAERAAAAAKEKIPGPAAGVPTGARLIKRENASRESPPASLGPTPSTKAAATSSFLGILADMDKKPQKEVKKEIEVPDETEEERSKRLRKESRRKLRVSWRADDSLVETRYFTHDPDEELDQGDRLKANAGGGREGEALKGNKSLDELEDEEDEDSFEDLEEYSPPSEVDFSCLENPEIGDDSPHKLNRVKFGGPVKPDSKSCEAQAKYEQDTLMAIYTSKADRPPTPKEPDDVQDDDDFEPAEPETPFGEPKGQIRQRERECTARQVPVRSTQPAVDLNALVQSMAAAQRPQQQPQAAIPVDLQRALGMYGQATQPVVPQQSAPAPGFDLAAILSRIQPQAQQPPNPPVSAAAFPSANLGALLASFQQQQPQQSVSALPLGMAANPNPFPGTSYEDLSRKHGRTDSANGTDDDYANNSKKWRGDGGGVYNSGRPPNYKTQVCTFWEQGKCSKGQACTYRHGDED